MRSLFVVCVLSYNHTALDFLSCDAFIDQPDRCDVAAHCRSSKISSTAKEGLDTLALVQYHLVMEPNGYEPAAQRHLDATFAALADPTRRAILARLALGEASVTELAGPFEMTQPAISKHLKVLERAGLISRDRDAQRRPSRLQAIPLAQVSEWLEHYRRFWETSFQRLDGLLGELKGPTKKKKFHKKR
jgi:DNA-binding transcriptional ArsR family regulator